MALTCPYCLRDAPDLALVCATCSRDIAVPRALAAERLDLMAKRDAVRDELVQMRSEIAAIRNARKSRTR